MLVGWSLRSKVIGQEDHGLNFGATGSIAYTSCSARLRSLLGMWVAYIMFTVRTCGGNPFCPLLFSGLGSSSSSLLSLVSELPGFLDKLLLRASQLSSPSQKRVMSVVRAAIDFGFSCPRRRASHSSRMLCLKAARDSASGQSTI